MVELVATFVAERARGIEKPTITHFWVRNKQQRANPWDNTQTPKVGMTWTLHQVIGDVCLVGRHTQTDPFNGDTNVEVELPILAILKDRVLSEPPPDIKVDSEHGWSSAILGLTEPVKGSALTSLAEANAIVAKQLGSGWRVAECRDGGGGWSFYGYWYISPTVKRERNSTKPNTPCPCLDFEGAKTAFLRESIVFRLPTSPDQLILRIARVVPSTPQVWPYVWGLGQWRAVSAAVYHNDLVVAIWAAAPPPAPTPSSFLTYLPDYQRPILEIAQLQRGGDPIFATSNEEKVAEIFCPAFSASSAKRMRT